MAEIKPVQKKTAQDPIAEITTIIAEALVKFKEVLGEKKFEKRVRKAAKLFAQGAKTSAKKDKPGKKIVPAKAAKKTATIKVKAAKATPAKKAVKNAKATKKAK